MNPNMFVIIQEGGATSTKICYKLRTSCLRIIISKTDVYICILHVYDKPT